MITIVFCTDHLFMVCNILLSEICLFFFSVETPKSPDAKCFIRIKKLNSLTSVDAKRLRIS